MSGCNEPTAEITALALRKAAEAAQAHHLGRLNDMRAAFIARVCTTYCGYFWNRRLYTREDAERHWPEDHSQIGYLMGPKVFEPPSGSSWHIGRADRAESLLDLATTKGLHDLRIPEHDVLFLRPFLNGEHDA